MTLPPEVFALLAAVCFAGSQVTVRRGLVDTSVVTGVVVTIVAALLVLGTAVLLDPPSLFDPTGIALFALGGLFAPGLSRWAATSGIHRLGPSVAVPIIQGTRPLLAVAGAILWLDETLDPRRLVGFVAIVIGSWQLSRSREEARGLQMAALEGPIRKRRHEASRFLKAGGTLPLIAGVAYAAFDIVVKQALGYQPDPSFGAMIGMSCALVIWVVAIALLPPLREKWHVGRGIGWVVMSGGLAGLALLFLFTALEAGDVTLVIPITAAQPLAVFLLSKLFLRDLERIHLATLLAGVTIVSGTIVISA